MHHIQQSEDSMTQHEIGSFKILPKSEKELLEHFSQYDFKDRYEHSLTSCLDFLELIAAYSKISKYE